MPTWPQTSLSTGFKYVQDTGPDGPEEGETWYDLGTDEAKVYDGANWHLLTVTTHPEVGDVQPGQHRSDTNVRATVDGVVDADTVDGQHASDLGGSVTFQQFSYGTEGASGSVTPPSGKNWYVLWVDPDGDSGTYTSSVTVHYADGNTSTFSSSGDNGPQNFAHRRGSPCTQIDYSVGDQYSSVNFAVMEVPA